MQTRLRRAAVRVGAIRRPHLHRPRGVRCWLARLFAPSVSTRHTAGFAMKESVTRLSLSAAKSSVCRLDTPYRAVLVKREDEAFSSRSRTAGGCHQPDHACGSISSESINFGCEREAHLAIRGHHSRRQPRRLIGEAFGAGSVSRQRQPNGTLQCRPSTAS